MAKKKAGIETSNAHASDKKEPRRKPLWLCIPTEFESFVDDNGEMTTRPKFFEIWECSSKPEVHRILASKAIDPDDLAFKHIKLFRADSIPLTANAQITFKF